MKKILAGLLILNLSSCATHRKSHLALMGSGFAAGAAGGALSSPNNEKKEVHAALWGGLLGLALGVAGLYLFDSEELINREKAERENLELELVKFKELKGPKLLGKGTGLFKDSLPEEAQKFIRPGEWRKYSVDQWVQDSSNPNTWLHYDLMYEFIPPSLSP